MILANQSNAREQFSRFVYVYCYGYKLYKLFINALIWVVYQGMALTVRVRLWFVYYLAKIIKWQVRILKVASLNYFMGDCHCLYWASLWSSCIFLLLFTFTHHTWSNFFLTFFKVNFVSQILLFLFINSSQLAWLWSNKHWKLLR